MEFFLGCDVSKGYADFVILDSKKNIVERNFQLDDTFEGHAKLYEVLSIFQEKHPSALIYAGLESTGGYENNWFRSLRRFGDTLKVRVARLNPYGVNHSGKAGLGRNITDKISAYNIAEYLINHGEKVDYDSRDYMGALRKKWKFTNMLTKHLVNLRNELESLVYTNNTEVSTYCKDGMSKWVMLVLQRWPTAKELANARVSEVSEVPYVSKGRAKELIDNAKKSVASSCEDGEIISTIVTMMLQIQETIEKGVEGIKNAEEFKELKEEIEILTSFPSIGDHSAIGLMLEIVVVERFKDVKKIASYFGVHPVYKMSGDGTWGFRMSKQGRKEVRRILFPVALSAIQHNPVIKPVYERHVKEGMNKMAVIGLCMHKILRIIYGMLKNKQRFNPEVDRQNREKSVKTLADGRIYKKERRYQEYSKNAPISRRQTKKRKQAGSQNAYALSTGSHTHFQKKYKKLS